jgi:hypothetical protein
LDDSPDVDVAQLSRNIFRSEYQAGRAFTEIAETVCFRRSLATGRDPLFDPLTEVASNSTAATMKPALYAATQPPVFATEALASHR